MSRQTKSAKPTKLVRYLVVEPVSINGTLIDPHRSGDVVIVAPPGLEGRPLKGIAEDNEGRGGH
jgi:hypothetical protein